MSINSSGTSIGGLIVLLLATSAMGAIAFTCFAIMIRRQAGIKALWAWAAVPGLFFAAIASEEWTKPSSASERSEIALTVLVLAVAVGVAPAFVVARAATQPAPVPLWSQIAKGLIATVVTFVGIVFIGVAAITVYRLITR